MKTSDSKNGARPEGRCPLFSRAGATLRRCLHCGQVWCTKCETGRAGETVACPVCRHFPSETFRSIR